MSAENSFKYQKLLWSFVLITAMTLFFIRNSYHSQSDLGSGFDLWVWFMIASFVNIMVSPIVIVLRLLRVIKNQESFGYILTGAINLCVGGYGLFQLIGTTPHRNNYFLFIIYISNLLFFLFIFIDVFIEELPGIRKA